MYRNHRNKDAIFRCSRSLYRDDKGEGRVAYSIEFRSDDNVLVVACLPLRKLVTISTTWSRRYRHTTTKKRPETRFTTYTPTLSMEQVFHFSSNRGVNTVRMELSCRRARLSFVFCDEQGPKHQQRASNA